MNASTLRAVVRSVLLAAMTIALLPVLMAARPVSPALAAATRRLWCRLVCLGMGVRVARVGAPFNACPTLFVANHVSYVDVPVIGRTLASTFIAKSEIAHWPGIGLLARLCGTMFIKRRWQQALIQRNTLAARIRKGEDAVLFGEGTSTNGLQIRPLKTSLLSVAEPWIVDRPVAVQTITLTYTRLVDGSPFDLSTCDRYAWYGDALFAPHLWALLKDRGVEVVITFGEPVLSWAVTSRKILAREIHAEMVATMAGVRGHKEPKPEPVGEPAIA